MYSEKICKICGDRFIPKSPRQSYCNKLIMKKCSVCGKEFESSCNPSAPKVCSRACASKLSSSSVRICEKCGNSFYPKSARQKYCDDVKIKTCPVCGKEFEYSCRHENQTCSVECMNKLGSIHRADSYSKDTKLCAWCGEPFNPTSNTQIYCNRTHYANCEICGKQYEIDVHTQDVVRTCSKECSYKLRFKDGNPFSRIECREKAKKTYLAKYGVDHPMKNIDVVNQIKSTYKARTGYDCPQHDPEVRSRSAKKARQSSLESRVASIFDEYHIEYIQHYMISSKDASHEFDFYLPKYNFLIDCDGVYFHAYLDDPNGKQVLDYYDEDRLALVPSDGIFHVIVEGDESRGIKWVLNCIQNIDNNVFDYEGELFQWCRSIDFPYPHYNLDRIKKDYARLCNYTCEKYVPSARLGDSAISQYHRSIYDAHVGNNPSPKEAWYDDTLLKKVIKNRLIYKNDVDPYKIMKGFNISKICPRVSVFNPVLGRYLTLRYLSEYSEVFDPFSGFSGRLLGVSSTGKAYVGQDLNSVAVTESNEIIQALELTHSSVSCKDILSSSSEYECMLTCPPYSRKEVYNSETEFKSCDEWIDECLKRFKCRRYVFVVDHTDKYSDNIVETISSTSHFCKVIEYVIVI